MAAASDKRTNIWTKVFGLSAEEKRGALEQSNCRVSGSVFLLGSFLLPALAVVESSSCSSFFCVIERQHFCPLIYDAQAR